jgi:hypothetical protein
MSVAGMASIVCLMNLERPALAWVYPEHRDIAVRAVQGLDIERKAVFDRLWRDARMSDEERMCEAGADTEQGLTPACIDWAALSGIAGDHSCSSRDMLETVRSADWILLVAEIGAQLKADLESIPLIPVQEEVGDKSPVMTQARERLTDAATYAKRQNALRTADNRLFHADHQYASRADANLAHFLLPRPTTDLDPLGYALLTIRPGSDINVIGVYGYFHLSALQKASRLAVEQLTAEEARMLAQSALFDEAFALHFLEDAYAAGHVAGSWGDVSQRKGTHDYYNRHGLEVFTWENRDRTLVLMGDAHMRPQDAEVAAQVVQTSLEQVLDAATGRSRGYSFPHIPMAPAVPDGFDICQNVTMPLREEGLRYDERYHAAAKEVLLQTPVPALDVGFGSMPRFRSEIGQFFGLAGSIEGRGISGGFEKSQTDNGLVGGLDLGLRVGLGLEGALGDGGDGLIFFQVGFRADSPSTNKFDDKGLGNLSGNLNAAIPARTGLSFRLRMPFYLVPGDLLLLSPLYFFAPHAYTQMAVTASNGGLIPWQVGRATPFGRFQFVLGRELGVTVYGFTGKTQLAAPSDRPGGLGRIVNFKSIFFDLPILEFRPYRAFSANQSSAVLFQLYGGADVPYSDSVESPPDGASVNLRTVWSIGLRMVFDWRYYR